MILRTFAGLDASAWTAVFTFGLFVMAIGTVTVAALTWRAGHRAYVVVDLEIDVLRKALWITVSNIGRTQAEDVTIDFEPRLESAGDGDRYRIAELPLWKEISSLAPSRTIRTFFDFAHIRRDLGLPDRYEVTVSYRSPVTRETRKSVETLDVRLHTTLTEIESQSNGQR